MKTSKIFTCLLFSVLLTFSFTTNAQTKTGSLDGTIKESDSGQKIAFAKIHLFDPVSRKSYARASDVDGKFLFDSIAVGTYNLTATFVGFEKLEMAGVKVKAGKKASLNLKLELAKDLDQVMIMTKEAEDKSDHRVRGINSRKKNAGSSGIGEMDNSGYFSYPENHNTESYAAIEENGYKLVRSSPLSTFSVDVDAASYSNVRRFLMSGNKPEKDAVRIEEMINYFDYDYPNPTDEHPFSITTEMGECPWNSSHRLVHVGLQGKRMEATELPPSNLVFLLDVSGSMNQANKLPLLKKSFKLLINELGEKDKIAIVVYAGAAGLVLESTTADKKMKILESLEGLRAGGSTAGGEGIKLAYKIAEKNFIEGGNNRIILATDGDFNVGISSDGSMKDLIEKKRESGVFLTCLGFGMGNYKDSKMEVLADKGNGNYAYIDNILEAKKVLVNEIGATLLTIAKDVKIQVEFNPNLVESYRLIGYENRLLNAEDFNDDTKDAGEIGAGHSVTALYEVVMKGEGTGPDVDELRYGSESPNKEYSDEVLTVKFRYKEPDGKKSKLISRHLKDQIQNKLSDNYYWSAAVASFGMILRDSEFRGSSSISDVVKMAQNSKGKDENGYRAEFIQLVKLADELLAQK